MRTMEWRRRGLACVAVALAAGLGGCKTLSERYIQLEVWKYERCFGHLPPGFVPPGAPAMQAAPAMRPCGADAGCQSAQMVSGDGCNQCQGGPGTVIEGGIPAGGTVSPGLPAGPGGSPGPMPSAGVPTPAAVTSSRPVVISDEVVLP
jgi:hypothetical protein